MSSDIDARLEDAQMTPASLPLKASTVPADTKVAVEVFGRYLEERLQHSAHKNHIN